MTIPTGTLDLSKMIARLAARYGTQTADAWTRAVLAHQKGISLTDLRTAIASGNVSRIEKVLKVAQLQDTLLVAMTAQLSRATQAGGRVGAQILRAKGINAQFNAARPTIAQYARKHAAALVQSLPKDTKKVIAEVVAMGAERGLTIDAQARAIREVVGLSPNWASAPAALADDLRAGRLSAAVGRRLSASEKQMIRSRIGAGTVDAAFARDMSERYAQSLINLRALTIARTESSRAAHQGLSESWEQAVQQGVLPRLSRRYWIVTPDDRLCKICMRIPGMNPGGRGLTEPFMTPEGLVMQPPAPHPNCRCSIGLVIRTGGSRARWSIAP